MPARRGTVLDGRAGAMTVGMALSCAALLVLVLGLTHIAAAVLARHRAQSAADLTALAAALAPRHGLPLCDGAAGIAQANGATLRRCTDDGNGNVIVEVHLEVLTGAATGRARAGPLGTP